jgi:hypothetical protein
MFRVIPLCSVSNAHRKNHHARPGRPWLEPLESRQLLSGDLAPTAIAGISTDLTITSGSGLLPSHGTYVFDAISPSSYTITGETPNIPDSSGSYTYTQDSSTEGTILFDDSQSGRGTFVATYTSTISGRFTETIDSGGSDAGVFDSSDTAGATQLVFTSQPGGVVAGSSVGTITVAAEDSSGNLINNFTGDITLGLKALPAGASLAPITLAAVDGVATFNNIPDLDIAGGYKLKATETGLTPGKSVKFFVTAGAATKLAFIAQPGDVAVGQPEGPITAEVEDQFGNILTSDSSTLVTLGTKVVPTGASFSPVAIDDVDGIATFTDVTFSVDGGYKLKATGNGLTPGKSVKFFVSD